MSAITEPTADVLEATRRRVHPHCVVCSRCGAEALGLRFDVDADGGVSARFDAREALQGYPSVLHGGVISSLLDGAMTNCLFARGVVAVTADLNVRFRHPVRIGANMNVSARVVRCAAPLFVVRAELAQDGQVRAVATGKFMQSERGYDT